MFDDLTEYCPGPDRVKLYAEETGGDYHVRVRGDRYDPLTVVTDIDGSPRSKNSETVGFIEASSVSGAKLNLETGTSVSTQV